MRKQVPLDIAYRLIGPGPIILVSSLSGNRAGITPVAWHMPVSDEPPIIALTISAEHFIHRAILETKDFVVNIPSSDMAETVRKLGSISGEKVDKFEKYGLAKEASKKVRSPRLGSAIAVIECKLRRDEAMRKKYDIILGDIVYAEAEEGIFTERWHPERGASGIMQHLGGKFFATPGQVIL